MITKRIGAPLYKPEAVDGHSWHEWMKFGPSDYKVFKVNTDGSASNIYEYTTKNMAMKATKMLNSSEKYTKREDVEFMALEFYYTDEWKLYLSNAQIKELEPRRVER